VSHPDTPPRAVAGIFFTHIWLSAVEWRFDFIVQAPPSALKLPVPVPPARADGLWKHTCFEVFLFNPKDGSYLEFNFAPSGEWAAYGFDGYRQGMRELQVVTPPDIQTFDPVQSDLSWKARMRRLGLEEDSPLMEGPMSLLPAMPGPPPNFYLSAGFDDTGLKKGTAWRAGVSAVIEEADGTKSYWALAHPPGEPDFHDPESFVLSLPAPRRKNATRRKRAARRKQRRA
jgi:hypothetical protein